MKLDLKSKRNTSIKTSSGHTNANLNSAAHNAELERLHGKQGHGYAAEQGNDLIDKLRGNDATVVGNDNKKNGPDRLVNGEYMQSKYGLDAAHSVGDAFKGGKYRYVIDGKAIPIEVPKDQYEDAVKEMAKRIKNVPGYENSKNPEEDARKLIRRGHLTYKQALNLAKAGTIESLTFDAVHGIVICTCAFGITTVINFAKSVWEGKNYEDAIEESLCSGLQVGGVTFTTSVISAQLVRTGLNASLRSAGKTAVKTVFKSKAGKEALVRVLDGGANIYGREALKKLTSQQLTERAGQLLASNAITMAVMTLVLSANDISKCFNGKISGKQLFKNMTTLVASLGGGAGGFGIGSEIGFAIGSLVPVPGGAAIGYWAGGLIGGAAAGSAAGKGTNKALSHFIEDDALKMVEILNKHFVDLAQEYLLSQEEVDIAIDDLKVALGQFKLLEMFASEDRDKFADDLLRNIIENIIAFRSSIKIPDENLYFDALARMEERIANGQQILEPRKIDPVKIGREITGRDIGEREAKKAWYVTKNINAINMQTEQKLINTKNQEKKTGDQLNLIKTKRQELNAEIAELLGE